MSPPETSGRSVDRNLCLVQAPWLWFRLLLLDLANLTEKQFCVKTEVILHPFKVPRWNIPQRRVPELWRHRHARLLSDIWSHANSLCFLRLFGLICLQVHVLQPAASLLHALAGDSGIGFASNLLLITIHLQRQMSYPKPLVLPYRTEIFNVLVPNRNQLPNEQPFLPRRPPGAD